jgi:putative iron-regulated protein
MKKRFWIFSLFVVFLGLGVGCGGVDKQAEMNEVAKAYAALVYANYTEVELKARSMKEAIDTFVASPSAQTLATAKQRWLEARVSYGQSEAFRFYNGPIDQDGLEGQINAWPLDEKYIDYVEGDDASGIINRVQEFPEITKQILMENNEKGGETNVATGWHAIEFLLWGQDLSTTGPGARPHTDYVEGGTAANQTRRGQYLKVVTELLLENLATVKEAWKPNTAGNYAASFVVLAGAKDAVQKMITGMGSLSGAELAGERMEVAYENKDQEDEHSCFSDNTHVDILENARGIQNIFLARYGGASQGASLYDLLVKLGKKELADKLKTQMEESISKIEAMPGAEKTPFDQVILGADDAPGRKRMKAAIDALREQTKTIAEMAAALEIQVNLNPE